MLHGPSQLSSSLPLGRSAGWVVRLFALTLSPGWRKLCQWGHPPPPSPHEDTHHASLSARSPWDRLQRKGGRDWTSTDVWSCQLETVWTPLERWLGTRHSPEAAKCQCAGFMMILRITDNKQIIWHHHAKWYCMTTAVLTCANPRLRLLKQAQDFSQFCFFAVKMWKHVTIELDRQGWTFFLSAVKLINDTYFSCFSY